MEYVAVCNLTRRHDFVARSWRNNASKSDYPVGEKFEYIFESATTLWLRDNSGRVVIVPTGEKQCFRCLD